MNPVGTAELGSAGQPKAAVPTRTGLDPLCGRDTATQKSQAYMQNAETETKLADLSKLAPSCLDELLQLEELKGEQWLMRLSVGGHSGSWQHLTLDSAANDQMIKERIEASDKPITDLVLAFVGMVEWRGKKQLMAYLQVFRSDYKQGVMCLRHLKERPEGAKYEAVGGFLVAGFCRNIWI